MKKSISKTYERTPKGDKMVSRITDEDADEVFYGDPDEASKIVDRLLEQGKKFTYETMFV